MHKHYIKDEYWHLNNNSILTFISLLKTFYSTLPSASMIFFSYSSFSRSAFLEFSACSNFASSISFFSNFTSSLNLWIRDSWVLSFSLASNSSASLSYRLLRFSIRWLFLLWAGYELFQKLPTWNHRARLEQIRKLWDYLNWKAFLFNKFLLLIVEFILDIIIKSSWI